MCNSARKLRKAFWKLERDRSAGHMKATCSAGTDRFACARAGSTKLVPLPLVLEELQLLVRQPCGLLVHSHNRAPARKQVRWACWQGHSEPKLYKCGSRMRTAQRSKGGTDSLTRTRRRASQSWPWTPRSCEAARTAGGLCGASQHVRLRRRRMYGLAARMTHSDSTSCDRKST